MANPAPGFLRDPQRKIVVEPYGRTVTVRFGDVVIASSDEAVELRESTYPPVLYIPFKDIYFEHLEKTATTTHCPFKGDATYWSASAQGEAASDVMWAYEAPFDEMLQIKDYGAFYPNKVSIDA
ncbi:DUF427 domain-containing protein [Mesorhizobium sp. CAU 1732]|uniref:DUF427 domain-containing protein n=1 Tax=Mesorhizobium sp. CAU 1732 TaxID=3140358 RepID=UPI003260AE1A